MKRIIYLLAAVFFVLIFHRHTHAQLTTPPKIEWQRSLGGSASEVVGSIQQTTEGGYIVVGGTGSRDGDVNKPPGTFDYWAVKLSSSGMTEWKGLYGGKSYDMASSIRGTGNGSYIISGYSSSKDVHVKDNFGGDDFWIVKLIEDTVISWESSFGGTNRDRANSIIPTFDGGYIAAGYSSSKDGMVTDNHGGYDYWVVKLSDDGMKEWAKSYGGSDEDLANSIQQTSDGGYIIAGESNSNDGNVTAREGEMGSSDYWVIKLSKDGSLEWQKMLGGSSQDKASCIQQTADDGYIVVGNSGSINGDVNGHHGDKGILDIWVVKLTKSGSIEWDRSLGGTSYDWATSIYETSDGGYVIAGFTNSTDGNISFNHGGYDFWLVKLSKTGILEWERSIGGSRDDKASSIQQTTDGGFIVAGNSASNDGDVSGHHGGGDDFDYWVVKLSPENPSSVEDESAITRNISISPNPTSSTATLTLDSVEEGACEVQIISVTGVTLKQYSTRIVTGKQEIALTDLESLPSGMYEVVVKRNGYLMAQTKLIVE